MKIKIADHRGSPGMQAFEDEKLKLSSILVQAPEYFEGNQFSAKNDVW